MALRTIGRELSGKVGRIRGGVVIGLVAAHASRRQGPFVVICRGMALHALHGRVEAGQRERRFAVIERRVRPRRRVMAVFAGERERT